MQTAIRTPQQVAPHGPRLATGQAEGRVAAAPPQNRDLQGSQESQFSDHTIAADVLSITTGAATPGQNAPVEPDSALPAIRDR